MNVAKQLKRLLSPVAIAMCLGAPMSQAKEIELPNLGDAASGIVSPQQEKELGEAWARSFRAQVPTSSDPQLADYTEKLMQQLVQYSSLNDKKLNIIMVENPSMNAFAVPGGVVGVHTGLFRYAKTEAQLSSVLAHELAHLSQRHFARGVEQQRNSSMPMMAAMMASLVLAATVGGDAGIAAMSATQAVALDARLKFSRQNEQEADRIGMQTMAAAGIDPYAAADMFEQMLQATRYSKRPPEFLLSHPVTERRIADTRNRAMRFPRRHTEQSLDYQLMRARVMMQLAETPGTAVKRFSSELSGDTQSIEASRYGLTIALIGSDQLSRAKPYLDGLLKNRPDHASYLIAQADWQLANDDKDQAINTLSDALQRRPNNHPLNVRLAEVLMQVGEYAICEEVLQAHSKRRPKDDYVWYLLAETHGLAGNILGVHQARSEYFILNGIYDKALKQLRLAQNMVRGDYRQSTILEEKIRSVRRMMDQQEERR